MQILIWANPTWLKTVIRPIDSVDWVSWKPACNFIDVDFDVIVKKSKFAIKSGMFHLECFRVSHQNASVFVFPTLHTPLGAFHRVCAYSSLGQLARRIWDATGVKVNRRRCPLSVGS